MKILIIASPKGDMKLGMMYSVGHAYHVPNICLMDKFVRKHEILGKFLVCLFFLTRRNLYAYKAVFNKVLRILIFHLKFTF